MRKKDKMKGDSVKFKSVKFKLEEGCRFNYDKDEDSLSDDLSMLRVSSDNPNQFMRRTLKYLKKRPSIHLKLNISKPEYLAKQLTLYTILREIMGSEEAIIIVEQMRRGKLKDSSVIGILNRVDNKIKNTLDEYFGGMAIEVSLDDLDLDENSMIDIHVEGKA